MEACEQCGGGQVSFGSRETSLPVIVDGRLDRRRVTVRRWRCRSCSRVRDERREDILATTRNAIRDLVVVDGIGGTASRLGCDERTVRSHLRHWISSRESDVADGLPEVLGVASLTMGGAIRAILTDPDEGALLDVASNYADAGEWVKNRPGRVKLCVVGLDAEAYRFVREQFPDAEVAVPPSTARRAIAAAATITLRQLSGGSRRNGRDKGSLVTRKDADLTAAEADEVQSFWSPLAKALRRHVLALCEGIGTTSEQFKAVLAGMREFCSRAPGLRLERLLDVWGTAFAAGAGERWLDVFERRLDTIIRHMRVEHRLSGIEVIRALLVFSDGPRIAERGPSVASLAAALRALRAEAHPAPTMPP